MIFLFLIGRFSLVIMVSNHRYGQQWFCVVAKHQHVIAHRIEVFMSRVTRIDVSEAKSQLCQLAERAWRGERVIITRAGKPYVDLLPHIADMSRRIPGSLKGRITIEPGFDKVPDDAIDDFEEGLL